jgi:hypothetical protein
MSSVVNKNTGIQPKPVTTGGSPPDDSILIGIERAFDVIENHTVHTKAYVRTAIQLIEEFGSDQDKSALNKLLLTKSQGSA